jgi:hypothetical protein
MVMIAGRVQLAMWIDDLIGLGGVKGFTHLHSAAPEDV